MILVKLKFKKELTLRKGRSGWRIIERDGGGRRKRPMELDDNGRRLDDDGRSLERERVFVRERETIM